MYTSTICLCGIKQYDNSCYSIIFPFQIIIHDIKYNKYIKTYRQLKKLLQQSNYLKDVLDRNIKSIEELRIKNT